MTQHDFQLVPLEGHLLDGFGVDINRTLLDWNPKKAEGKVDRETREGERSFPKLVILGKKSKL